MSGARAKRRTVLPLASIAVVALTCLFGAPAAAGAEPDPAAWLFDPGAVVEIELDVAQGSIDALELDPDEYQPGTFTLTADGVTHPALSVGLRLKGAASARGFDGKAGFKVKFNEFVKGQKFEGLKKLTLNNMIQDPSMTHEALAYETFRALEVAAPRSGYAFVRVNGTAYGLYANVETLDDISLPRWFATTQHLYEGPSLVDVTTNGAGGFEVDEGDDEDLADLEALIEAANDGAGDWSEGIAATADLEQMTRMWAVERYVGHWDGYAGSPNNYYLHSDDAGLFSMLPWGTDQTWGDRIAFDGPGGWLSGGLLFNRCLADESCRSLYVEALEELREVVPGLGLDQRAAGIAALLAPYQALESEQRREATLAEVESALESTREFIAARPGDLDAWLAAEEVQPEAEDEDGETPDELDAPPLKPVSAGATPERPGLTVADARVRGATVSTRVNLAGPGRLTQRVLVRVKRNWRTACLIQVPAKGAGSREVSCRLSAEFRRKLEAESLRLEVWIGFEPETGGVALDQRRLTAPRLATSR